MAMLAAAMIGMLLIRGTVPESGPGSVPSPATTEA